MQTNRYRAVVGGIKELLETRNGQIGLAILLPILLISIAAPVIAPYSPTETHPVDRFADPSEQYLLGTDNFGRDILSRVMYGGRTSLFLGVTATMLGVLAGAPLGMLAGYRGGRTDELIMRSTDALLSFPSLLLTLLVLTVLGSNVWNAILAIGIVFTPRLARITRGATLSVKNEEYVTAAEARGEGTASIIAREILPNVAPAVVVEASIRVGFAILIGTALSYLGLGTQPPFPDWGYMISEANETTYRSVWFLIWPSIVLGLTVISFNLLGDGLREVLDPEVNT